MYHTSLKSITTQLTHYSKTRDIITVVTKIDQIVSVFMKVCIANNLEISTDLRNRKLSFDDYVKNVIRKESPVCQFPIH